jgi:uncharacterized radical SAM superfamily Fe-S cluster-containing enzyme
MKHNRSNRPARRNDGRIIGSFDGVTLRLKRKRSRHLYRVLDAWAIDLATLVSAADAGVERVVVVDSESGETYEAELDDILNYGTVIDHGFGTQVALPLQYWLRSSALQARLGI